MTKWVTKKTQQHNKLKHTNYSAAQNRKAVTDYFTSKQ